MRTIQLSIVLLAVLAACTDGSRAEGGVQPADSAATVPLPAGTADTSSLPVPPRAARTAEAAEALPTREDSVAAAAEDVSPEWKQRERSLSTYDECMRQARGLEDEVRATVLQACERRRGAPR